MRNCGSGFRIQPRFWMRFLIQAISTFSTDPHFQMRIRTPQYTVQLKCGPKYFLFIVGSATPTSYSTYLVPHAFLIRVLYKLLLQRRKGNYFRVPNMTHFSRGKQKNVSRMFEQEENIFETASSPHPTPPPTPRTKRMNARPEISDYVTEFPNFLQGWGGGDLTFPPLPPPPPPNITHGHSFTTHTSVMLYITADITKHFGNMGVFFSTNAITLFTLCIVYSIYNTR
jgi:hypothetical protein